MPETGATYHPKPLTFVESDPMTENLAALVALATGRVVDGLDLTYDGLTAHISPGFAMVMTDDDPRSVYYVTIGSQVDEALTANSVNYVWLTATADIIVNTSGSQPADSIPLYEITTGASAVTGTPEDVRSKVVDIGEAIKAVGADMSSAKITNLGPPTAASDAARLADAEGVVMGAGGMITPVRVATTAAVAHSGLLTVDDVVLVSGDRVLDKNHATTPLRGIWVAQSGAWTRAEDFDSSDEVLAGTLVLVSEGTVNQDSVFGLDTDGVIVVGTTGLTFTRRDVKAHQALTTAHGAVVAATPNTMVVRDVDGTAKFGTATEAGEPIIHGQAAGGDVGGTFPDNLTVAGIQKDWKDSVLVATTANITLSGEQTIDGVAVTAGKRVLVKNQTAPAENGPYLCAAGAWTRTTDADSDAKVTTGMATYVESGTVNAQTIFYLTTTGTIVLGTTGLTFTKHIDAVGVAVTSAPTASTIVKRDTNARTQFANPSAAGDAVVFDGQIKRRVAKTASFTADVNVINDIANVAPATETVVTVPVSPALGDEVEFFADANTGLVSLKENNASDTIKFNSSTTAGTGSDKWKAVSGRAHMRAKVVSLSPNVWVVLDANGQWDNAAAVRQHMADATKPLRVGAPEASTDAMQFGSLGGATPVLEWTPGVVGPFSNLLVNLAITGAPTGAAFGRSSNGQVIVLAAAMAGSTGWTIFISTDGGRNWARTAAVPATGIAGNASGHTIAIFVTDANTFSIAFPTSTANTIGFTKTTDGGANWTTNTKTVTNLSTANATPVIVGIDSAIFAYAVSSTSIGYAKTADAGANWTNGTVATETVSVSAGTVAIASLDITTTFIFWSVGGSANLRWSKTTDGGANWDAAASAATDGTSASKVEAIQTSANKVLVSYKHTATDTFYKTIRTTDGSTWNAAFSTVAEGINVKPGVLTANVAIAYDGTTLVVFIHQAGSFAGSDHVVLLYSSTDEGATWTKVASIPHPITGTSTSPIVMICLHPYLYGNKILTAYAGTSGTTAQAIPILDTRKVVHAG